MDSQLRHHGDTELGPGLVDLAVNVRTEPMPNWLAGPIAASLAELARYPDQGSTLEAVARLHRRDPDEVLLTAGAAQAFVLLARVLAPRRAVVVHPQFTEPEAALRAAGHTVERVILDRPFALDPSLIPADADLVVLGNPTNPTSVAHAPDVVAGLARPGRVLVVDEAFADTVFIPGRGAEPTSLATRRDLPGLVVIRSLTKTWGLAGLRVGYLLGPADLVARLREAAPLWPVSTPALAAIRACATPEAQVAAFDIARRLAAERDHLVEGLRSVEPASLGSGSPASSFVLVHLPDGLAVRDRLRQRGWAVRRGDTFPGLGPDWLRIAVRSTATSDAFLTALADSLR